MRRPRTGGDPKGHNTVKKSLSGIDEIRREFPDQPNHIHMAILHEGYESHVYPDPIHGEKKPTIGIGFLLTEDHIKSALEGKGYNIKALVDGEAGLLKSDAIEIFEDLSRITESELRKIVPTYDELSDIRKAALIDMGHNLGTPRLKKFSNLISALESGNFSDAGAEMLDSRWAEQVGDRADRLAEIIATGEYPSEISGSVEIEGTSTKSRPETFGERGVPFRHAEEELTNDEPSSDWLGIPYSLPEEEKDSTAQSPQEDSPVNIPYRRNEEEPQDTDTDEEIVIPLAEETPEPDDPNVDAKSVPDSPQQSLLDLTEEELRELLYLFWVRRVISELDPHEPLKPKIDPLDPDNPTALRSYLQELKSKNLDLFERVLRELLLLNDAGFQQVVSELRRLLGLSSAAPIPFEEPGIDWGVTDPPKFSLRIPIQRNGL